MKKLRIFALDELLIWKQEISIKKFKIPFTTIIKWKNKDIAIQLNCILQRNTLITETVYQNTWFSKTCQT